MTGGPLGDITVVDLTRALAGPHAAMMLADLGARVIKVETPGNGDDTRGWGPPFVGPAHPDGSSNPDAQTISTYFLSANRNKESVVLDLKSDAGRAALTELIRRGDVLLENFRPGVLDRLGFSMATMSELNPGLVVLSISGFGHDGPEGGRAGYDQIAQGEAGLMSMTGPDLETPSKVGVPISDLLAGMYGAYGVVAKLHERGRTGRGGLVRTSLLASVVGVHAYQGTRWTVAGEVPKAEGPHHPSICPYGLFHSADGIVQIAVGSEGLWKRFAPAFGIPLEGAEYSTNADRVRNSKLVRATVEKAFAEYSTPGLLAKLAEIGVPSGEVKNLQQVYDWDQTRSQGLLIDVEHPALGRSSCPAPRYGSSRHPVRNGTASTPLPRCTVSTPTRCWHGWPATAAICPPTDRSGRTEPAFDQVRGPVRTGVGDRGPDPLRPGHPDPVHWSQWWRRRGLTSK